MQPHNALRPSVLDLFHDSTGVMGTSVLSFCLFSNIISITKEKRECICSCKSKVK